MLDRSFTSADVSDERLGGLGVVRHVQRLLAPLLAARLSTGKSERDPRRLLSVMDFFSLLLFALYNPVIGTLRGLEKAAGLARVQRELGSKRVSLASLSDAQHMADPLLLRGVIAGLRGKAAAIHGDRRLRGLGTELVAVDGTLFTTLPRVAWALRGDYVKSGAKLHVKFNVLNHATVDALLTPGKTCERKTLRAMLVKGELYIGDRYYGLEYALFDELTAHGCGYVIRLRDNARYETTEERELTAADRAAGVESDRIVRLGARGIRCRLVCVAVGDKRLLIATNREDLAAELIGLIYQHRWQIELFFKWIKCILGCRHLLLESEAGVASQLYAACILALVFTISTGRKPTKRQWELIQFGLMGWATPDELAAGLGLNEKPKPISSEKTKS